MYGIATVTAAITIAAAAAIRETVMLHIERKQRAAEIAAVQREGAEKFKAMLNEWRAEKGLKPVE